MNPRLKAFLIRVINFIPGIFGVYQFFKGLTRLPSFWSDYRAYTKEQKRIGETRFPVHKKDFFPCLFDKTATTSFEPHYVYHPAWAARTVKEIAPAKHIDISSTLQFCAMLSAFMPVEFYDYRPAELNLSGLTAKRGDLLALPFEDSSVDSISCMHTVEHVGLGRYGDPIDPNGDIKAARELSRVVAKGGNLLFVVPVGASKIEFNAHRIYAYEQVLNMFPNLRLKEFSMVPDDYKTFGLIRNADKDSVKDQTWACGCFWFVKD